MEKKNKIKSRSMVQTKKRLGKQKEDHASMQPETPYHESNTLSSMFVASENDIDDVMLVESDVELMNCDEDEFMNDDNEDNESEYVEPTYESEDKEASEEDEDDGVD
ncbi:hypothetical protein L6452_06482 [Arctium lappa]|uniref:Uncharacterized protein n=1 Tax=Arctium lappa TaxID=4217 RepID=A0ACB9EJ07_ARCLA|nr:hypothetical protein L6452_06482 [Arctium lappa]